jgi:hypothetical protein
MAGEIDKPAPHSIAGRATEAVTKGVGGWWEGFGDRTISQWITKLTPTGGWLALAINFIHNHGVALKEAIPIGLLATVPVYLAASGLISSRRMHRRLADVETKLAERSTAASSSITSGLEVPPEKVTTENEHKVALRPVSSPDRPVEVVATRGKIPVRAIGSLRAPTIHPSTFNGKPRFDCQFYVDFFGLTSFRPSPETLKLMDAAGKRLIAILRAKVPTPTPDVVHYQVSGEWADILPTATYIGTTAGGDKILICQISIHLPDGYAHDDSGVKLDFELAGLLSTKTMTVPVIVLNSPLNRAVLSEIPSPPDPVYGIAKIGGMLDAPEDADPLSRPRRNDNEPNWPEIARMEYLELWQLICLSFDRSPDSVPDARDNRAGMVTGDDGRNQFEIRMNRALSHLGPSGSGLPCDINAGHHTRLKIRDFAKWTIAEFDRVPLQFHALLAPRTGA